jgi:hypothetical protein
MMDAEEMKKKFKQAQEEKEIAKILREKQIKEDTKSDVLRITQNIVGNMLHSLEFPFYAYISSDDWKHPWKEENIVKVAERLKMLKYKVQIDERVIIIDLPQELKEPETLVPLNLPSQSSRETASSEIVSSNPPSYEAAMQIKKKSCFCCFPFFPFFPFLLGKGI